MSYELHVGDCLEIMRGMPDASVDCVVTSPPYWGLRDYGVAGQIGLEATPQEYVARMRDVFMEVHRLLSPTGTLWLNIGDNYAGSWGAQGGPSSLNLPMASVYAEKSPARNAAAIGLKPKDLVGIPWRLAFALQDAGWWLRSDIIWSKPNPMPESVRDRPTKAHEYLFLLSKSARYFYDPDAIRTEAKGPSDYKMPDGWDTGAGGHGSFHRNGREKGTKRDKQRGHSRRHAGFNERWDAMSRSEQLSGGANARTVWTIPTQPFKEPHFATFPIELPRRCILAGCAEGGVVLDPFAGSGTTLAAAVALGRKAIGIELNPEYAEMIERRMAGVTPSLFAEVVG